VSRPEVDVGIVSWNTRELTLDVIRRLREDQPESLLRVFVRDNGSTDGTPEAIAETFPDVTLDADGRNLGFGAGMNRLIARSDGPWFFALNSDAWPARGAVARLVTTAEAHPRAAAVAPRLERPDGSLEHSTYPFPSWEVAAITALGLYRRFGRRRAQELQLVGAWHHDVSREVDWAVGAALLMRREALDAIGGFDERFFMYAEDLEWGWRAHRAGWETWFEPAAVVTHVGNASGAKAYGGTRTLTYLRNTYRFYAREHGRGSTAVYRALNLAGSLRLLARSKLRRDEAAAREWRRQVRAHLTPVRGPDGPPTGLG
jgi:GT2 family glycosyltransferase